MTQKQKKPSDDMKKEKKKRNEKEYISKYQLPTIR